jgi:hypothetical protein
MPSMRAAESFRLFVIDDENVHRDNLAADCCFLGLNGYRRARRYDLGF